MDPFRAGARGALLGIVLPLIALCVDARAQSVQDGAGRLTDLAALREWSARADRHRQAIAEEESRNGPHSPALIDPLMSLGLVHQEYGQHDLAIEAVDRALQIRRINDGIYSLEQAPLIRQLLASELARGNLGAAAELDVRMVQLARRNPDDARSVPIFHAAADRQLAQYERYLEEGFPPQILISSNLSGTRSLGDPTTAAGRSFGLRQARRNYMAAIRSILRRGEYGHEDLLELERGLVRTYYLESTTGSSPNRAGGLYYLGRESYRRRVAYAGLNSGTPLDFGRALVELADWDLLFSRNGRALEQYDAAHALLVAEGVPDASIREIFGPARPVLLPTFLPNPLAADAPGQATAHIDVTFELSKYGVSRKIEILEASASATDESTKALIRLIARNRFRPRLTETESADSQLYHLRYYVSR